LVDANLESIGLPRARAHTIRNLAREVADGTLQLDASQGLNDIVERLCKLPGLGGWTAQYIAMRAFGEPDAFPSSDLGLRKAAGNGHGPVSAAKLERMAQRWRPWRAYAAMALWLASATGVQKDKQRDSSSKARSA
jgi:3-methyladenine DNA glycosylase/8-oxoguanine DNA glycosylase